MKKLFQKIIIYFTAILPIIAMAQTPAMQQRIVSNGVLTSNSNVQIARAVPTDLFSTTFQINATGRNNVNAYLLCYLSTLIYPDYIAFLSGNKNNETYINSLHNEPKEKFLPEFKKQVEKYFDKPEIEFFHKSDRLGYDPEAMVISTSTAVYVVFRGTDRVGSNKSGFGYDWAEWISTDFDPRQVSSPFLTGKVLAGMWGSLEYENFNVDLFNYMDSKGGKSKKVWITGHSLGAAQAQLFAMYAAKKGITAQGVYGFAAPNPGDAQFAAEMDRIFPNNRLQRFEFVSDPITVLAQAVGCTPAGARVYYDDIATMEFDKPERNPIDFLNIIPGVVGVIGNSVTDFIRETSSRRINLDVFVLGNSVMCYHHPTWYLQAAYKQLNASEITKVPLPLALPKSTDEACDASTVARGIVAPKTIEATLRDATADLLKNISIIAGNLAGNISGSVLTRGEGTYKITCLQGGKSLALAGRCDDQNGCQAILWQDDGGANMRFQVFKYGLGYGLRVKSSDKVLDVTGQSIANGARVKTWAQHGLPVIPNNQIWYFVNVGGNKYVIQNERSGKVLDADNPNTGTNGCEVMQWQYRNGSNNQVWVFEKVN